MLPGRNVSTASGTTLGLCFHLLVAVRAFHRSWARRTGYQKDTSHPSHFSITEGHAVCVRWDHNEIGSSSWFSPAAVGPMMGMLRAEQMNRRELLNRAAGLAAGMLASPFVRNLWGATPVEPATSRTP